MICALFVFLVTVSLAFTSSVLAAPPDVPARLSYQGVLLDDQGAPRTGSVDLGIRIYDTPTFGTLLYVQAFANVPLADGVFTVEIGPTGQATDTPLDPLTTDLMSVFASDLGPTGPNRFLQITVGLDAALTRTQILTAPFALRAGQAASADFAAAAGAASEVTTVGGLPAEVVTQIFENTNLDGQGPPNADPAEGTADPDGDGVFNFVDPDNDGDGLLDGTEVAQGSDINLVTPTLTLLSPVAAPAFTSFDLTGFGSSFDPTMTVTVAGGAVPLSDVTATSFDATVPAQGSGGGPLPVVVTLTNGESASLSLPTGNFISHSVDATASETQISFGAGSGFAAVVGGDQEYGIDRSGSIDLDDVALASFPGAGALTPSQLAVGFDPAGTLVGLRCKEVVGVEECDVEVLRDDDADGLLEDTETLVVIERLTGSGLRFWAPRIAFDSAGRIAAFYYVRTSNAIPRLAHDRDGNLDFSGPAERVSFDATTGAASGSALGFDPNDRVAFAYHTRSGVSRTLEVFHDRTGDGYFADPGENPSIALTSTITPISPCVGLAFDGSGRLGVVVASGAVDSVRLHHDLNDDGDFADGGESTQLGFGTSSCDLARAPSGGLAAVEASGGLRLLIDRNADEDFGDADEQVVLDPGFNTVPSRSRLRFNAEGRAVAASSEGRVYIDPTP